MDYSTWAFLMLAVGLVLMVAEVFIPSGGIILVLAVGSLGTALVCAWNAWWGEHPAYFWTFVGGMVVTLPVSVGMAFHIWPSTPLGRRAILEGPAPHEIDAFGHQEERHNRMVGQIGVTVTTLNPAGIALIDGARVHCQSEGMILDAGVRVRVIGSRMNTVIVRQTTQDASAPNDATRSNPDSPAGTPSGSSLDFELT